MPPLSDVSNRTGQTRFTGQSSNSSQIRVLNVVTNPKARFYDQQVSVLERYGVSCTTLTVPGGNHSQAAMEGRSPSDYLRFYPTVLKHSFDDYDIVHANYGLTGPLALFQPRLPVVLSLWGSDLLGKYGWLSRLCAARSDAVIVMSERMAQELDDECDVIPHGVDLELFRPIPQEEARETVGWDAGGHHVLFPYAPNRDVKNYPRAKRVVAAAEKQLGEPITLQTVHGAAHDEMPYYMNAADALLVTSHREGSPNSVKEAMACNLPIVATDAGDVRERLAGATASGVYTTDEDLVDGLVRAFERGERSNGRDIVREVSLQRMADQIVGVYERVLS